MVVPAPVWADFVSGSLTTTIPAINAGSTQTMTSDGLTRLPAVDINPPGTPPPPATRAKISLDPFATLGDPELVYVTYHAAGANTATIQRIVGQPLRQHLASEAWVHGPTAEDFVEFQAQLDNQLHASIFTAAGQLLGSTGPAQPAAVNQGTDWQALTIDSAQPTRMHWRNIPFKVTSTTRPVLAAGAYEGMLIYETDTDHVLVCQDPTANSGAGNWIYVDNPPGTITMFGGTTLPSGYVWCTGQLLDGSTTQYAALYAAIGVQFGSGTGSQFRVPDLRNRFVYGWDPTNGGANSVPGGMGYTEGADSYPIGVNNLPPHQHGIADHVHSMVHHHTAQNGTENLGQKSPYPILSFREDGSPQKLMTTGDGLAVSFSWMDDFTGNTGGMNGATTSGPGAGANGDALSVVPRRVILGYMIRR